MSEWAQYVRPQLARLRLEGSRESEIIEELSQHLDQRFDELRREGFSEERARQLAVDELVEPVALGAQMQPLRQASRPPALTLGAPGASLLGDLWQDVRYGLRMIGKQPLFAAAVILTLGLGIGANSAIFALVDATLLRPLPLPDPGRLVLAWDKTAATPRGRVAALNMLDWADRSRTVASIGAFLPNVGGMVMGNVDGLPETVSRQWVTSGLFSTLGLAPIAGRAFTREDDVQGRNVVVLSEAFWRERFNGDTRIIGRPLRLDGDPYTVVGVVPKAAQIVGRSSLWALLPITGAPPRSRGQRPFVAVARLKPGVDLAGAQSDLDAVAAGLAREFPDTNANRGVGLEPLHEVVLGTELRQTSMLFVGVVGLVLLICCANVANLLLTRATVRQRELAVRAALGANRGRVIRQLLTESLLLSCLGGALGLAIGTAILRVAPSVVPQELLPAVVTLGVDLRVAAFCAVTAVIVGLLFGLAPAWQATSPAAVQSTAGSRTMTGRGGRLRNLLVMGQVATAVVLLFGAGLLLRTLLAVEGVDRGYRAEQVLSMVLDPMSSAYPTDAAELQFYQAIEHEIRALPGVAGVAWATTLPLGPSYEGDSPFEIEGAATAPDGQRPSADMQIVSPSFFDTLRVPVAAGRAFDDRDVPGATPVCMVNEAFVRKHFPGGSPIGRRLAIRDSDGPQAATTVREIVGVARQIKGSPTETGDFVQIYVPLAQDTPGDIFLMVTPVAGSAGALTTPVREAIARIDTAQLVSVRAVMTLDDVVADANARHRFRAVLVVAFAALSLVLAMVGLFGILAYSVQQRIRDFGVRRALGASTGHVMALVAGNALWVIGLGALAGLVLSYMVGRLLATMLFGVRPSDPLTFALVAIVMTIGALLSTIGPAWRAARVEPAAALRRD